MKGANAAILVAVGLVVLYLTVTGKLDCFVGAFRCAFLDDKGAIGKGNTATGSIPKPSLPNLGKILKSTLPLQ